jgi:outer membrane protein assembly factor BamB
MKGKLKWKTPIGKPWSASFPESRCTPTIEGNWVYVSSGLGVVACVEASNGVIKWKIDAAAKFGAKFNWWGVAESLIIKDDKVYFSPVGPKTTVVALNKNTGETIWQSESLGDSLAYVSPILINYGGKSIISGMSASYFYGVDASSGKMLWKYRDYDLHTPSWHPNAPIINCVTPIYDKGKVYITSGYNHVGAMFKIANDANGVQLLWSDTILDCHHGGVLKIGDYIYGSNWIDNGNGNWCCIDWNTGKTKYETKWKCKGSIISDGKMLYCSEEKSGYLALVPADPEKFEVLSSFKIPYGKGPYWSHPVIKDGILYVRHGTALMAYNIKQK